MEIIAEDTTIKIGRLSLGPYGTNSYILICRKTGASLIVDAPGNPEKVHEALQNTAPCHILITHNHFDHTGALVQLKSDLKIPVAAHASDADRLPLTPDILLKHKDAIKFGDIGLTVLHTPGHTPGSICFYYGKYLISGDTMFPGGPGKTGSPAAFMQIRHSLENSLFTLPDDVTAFPGHGGSAVIGEEKEKYRIFCSKPHDPDLCGDVVWLSA
jgi:glyoxylase-like metal-dependent hydrolase (beta-lactamase superfamily II)